MIFLSILNQPTFSFSFKQPVISVSCKQPFVSVKRPLISIPSSSKQPFPSSLSKYSFSSSPSYFKQFFIHAGFGITDIACKGRSVNAWFLPSSFIWELPLHAAVALSNQPTTLPPSLSSRGHNNVNHQSLVFAQCCTAVHKKRKHILCHLLAIALETVPMLVWLNMDQSQLWTVEPHPLSFSSPLPFKQSNLWCSGLSLLRMFLKPPNTSALPSCRAVVMSALVS